MNNPFDHIEEYLSGELSTTDAQAFEEALATDAALREEVEMVKEMELFAQRKADSKGAIDVVRQVMEDGERIEEGKVRSKSFVRATAAVVLLCLAAIAAWVFFGQGEKAVGHEELFAEYFDVPEMAIIKKSESQDSILQLVQGLFNSKQYDRSITNFKNIIPSDDLNLYRAINYQMVDKPDSSLIILNSIANKTSDSEWYKAMSYLQLGEIEKTKETLKNIEERSIHFNDSQELIKQL